MLSKDSCCSVDGLCKHLVRPLKALCLAPETTAWRWHLSGSWRRGEWGGQRRGEESAVPCCYKYAAAMTAHRGSSWEEELLLCYIPPSDPVTSTEVLIILHWQLTAAAHCCCCETQLLSEEKSTLLCLKYCTRSTCKQQFVHTRMGDSNYQAPTVIQPWWQLLGWLGILGEQIHLSV